MVTFGLVEPKTTRAIRRNPLTAQTHLPVDFDWRLIVSLKGALKGENLRLIRAWRRCEGGTAKWNPLNSTLWVAGFTDLPNYNEDGPVRNYSYENAGLAATILTFTSREPDGRMRYGGIVGDMQAGVKTADQIVVDRRAEFERWGTDVDLLLRVVGEMSV